MTRLRQRVPKFDAKLKAAAKRSLKLAADWAVRNQVTDAWPFWDANRGRFPYHVLIDRKRRAASKPMWSTCWKTARTVQGLYSAHAVTGKRAYLDAAERGLDYVATLQFLEPGYERYHGAFREDSPQGPHLAYRDGIEAIQALISGYLATGSERWLRRAVIGADWSLRTFRRRDFPVWLIFPLEGRETSLGWGSAWCFLAGAIVFAQLAVITGRKEYVTRGAAPMARRILRNNVLPSGALGIQPEHAQKTHHTDGAKRGAYHPSH